MIREIDLAQAADLVQQYHGYKGSGCTCTYAFGYFSPSGDLVAAWIWLPPAPGSARSVSPGDPRGALALSRMIAIPKADRPFFPHISKGLREIQKRHIDRDRWPVLVTYSDAGQGHTGYVYQCAGWTKEGSRPAQTLTLNGVRVSRYSAGRSRTPEGAEIGSTEITRWTHRVTPKGTEAAWLARNFKEEGTGRRWRSGAEAKRLVHRD